MHTVYIVLVVHKLYTICNSVQIIRIGELKYNALFFMLDPNNV